MKTLITLLLFIPMVSFAQLSGKIKDLHDQPLIGATITLQNTYLGTSSGHDGHYELRVTKPGTYTISVHLLGYETTNKTVEITQLPYQLDFQLTELETNIEEVVITNRGNPADRIMRAAIKHKKINGEKYDKYNVDFYSKGVFKIIELPKKILGQNIEDDDNDTWMLDSTRSGILYLSETVSEVSFERPNNFRENIIASKISGNDRGYSFNTALGSNFDFYRNYVPIMESVISPLADQAFSYYKFRLEDMFDSDEKTIFKIGVTPKRSSEPTVTGYIYIVDDTWEIYGVDVKVQGKSVNQPILDSLHIHQQYVFNSEDNIWTKQSQNISLHVGVLGLKFSGQFAHIFNNYTFVKSFEKGTFGKTIIKMQKDANKKDSIYWSNTRPIHLKEEEKLDYHKKDSVQLIRNSSAYLDSVDRVNNRFKPLDFLFGYKYSNSRSKTFFRYNGLNNITSTTFNAVQGVVGKISLGAGKRDSEEGRHLIFNTDLMYGFSDKRLRINGSIEQQFDSRLYRKVRIEGGSDVVQFNQQNPIHPFVNSVASLFWKQNFIKLYQRDYARLSYQQILIPDLKISGGLEYNRRSPLFNSTNYSFIREDWKYPSNHPLDESDYDTAPFEQHQLMKWNVELTYQPGKRVIDRPDRTSYISHPNTPEFKLGFEQGFGSSYGYQAVHASLLHELSLRNKGVLNYHLKAGTFFNHDQMAFMDYKHFNGNLTHIGTGSKYINHFLIMPYYTYSTNQRYLETHAEHNFKGFILNKIPLFNKLGLSTIIGHHHFTISDSKSYHEFTVGLDNIGFGKYRFLRVDYVKSFYGNKQNDGVVIGLKFLKF